VAGIAEREKKFGEFNEDEIAEFNANTKHFAAAKRDIRQCFSVVQNRKGNKWYFGRKTHIGADNTLGGTC